MKYEAGNMASVQYAFLKKSHVPSSQRWQSAINECGFALELDPELIPHKQSGFSPCTLNGVLTGVEIDYAETSEFMDEDPTWAGLIGNNDCCISFRWGSSVSACATAMIASYALAACFGAVVSYEGDAPLALPDFLSSIHQTLAEI